MKDLLHDTEGLKLLANKAFCLGLEHGSVRSGPMDADSVMLGIGGDEYTRRKYHRAKLRQVYGAGFDIAKLNRKVIMALSRGL